MGDQGKARFSSARGTHLASGGAALKASKRATLVAFTVYRLRLPGTAHHLSLLQYQLDCRSLQVGRVFVFSQDPFNH